MNWYHHPQAVDQLASSYVLGTLQGRARQRFETVMYQRPEVATAVDAWTQRLVPLLTGLPPLTPSDGLWDTIALRADILEARAKTATVPWWKRWLAPIPAGALAMGLVLGSVAPALWHIQNASQTELPESYVGVLATAEGKPGLIVSSLREGRVVDIKQVKAVAVPVGAGLFLWRIDSEGHAAPLGTFGPMRPVGKNKWAKMALSEPAEKVFFPAVELAVSVEPLGSTPAVPGGAFVYRGLCGKLWR